ncbi:MAG: AMP-binding protein [Acidobacteria bacterium]|nr:AMP-binding protein [Acidobacteriota bacterium]
MAAVPTFASRAEIKAFQFGQLSNLLAALVPGNAFYTGKFQAAGFRHADSLEDYFARAPFTLRSELTQDQTEHPPFGSNLTFPRERYTRYCQTSGTTGKPMRWLDTSESWQWMISNWRRVYEAAGLTAEDRIFFAFSFGPFLGFWVAFDAASAHGCLAIPGGGMPSTARLATIIDAGATVLCCTPTYALRLAEVAQAEHIDLATSRIRRIIVAGEAGGSVPSTRAQIEKLWNGARVVDHHGMTEVGPVSYECPVHSGTLHIIESSYIAEVLDGETLTPVPEGSRGELVLTNLGRTGSPLLRYRTGDIVERGRSALCDCGTRDLALPGGILTRTDDMVVVRGVNVYPAAIENILRTVEGIAEYRVEVHSEHALRELRIVVEPEIGVRDRHGLEHRVHTALNAALGLRIAVASAAPGELPRFELKAKRWIRI